ncbi:hypothetical protein BDI4_910061 [Burkholderia diffusa]|nr:hypothetical protein BDI4_910061 [Burkholderia diffusa]
MLVTHRDKHGGRCRQEGTGTQAYHVPENPSVQIVREIFGLQAAPPFGWTTANRQQVTQHELFAAGAKVLFKADHGSPHGR